MPARRFFSMYRAALRLEALEALRKVEIAAIPSCKPAYMDGVSEKYVRIFNHTIEPEEKEIPKTPDIEADLDEKTNFMMQQLALLKQVNYGR